MAFERQISNFVNHGTFNYQFDEAGNLILNPLAPILQQNWLAMDLVNFDYNETKVLSFYDPTFQEFIKPTATGSVIIPFELQEYIDNISKENEDLRVKLDEVISSASDIAKSQSDENEIKDILLGLRVALGQGKTTEDFYTTFPYLPLTAGDQATGETTIEEMLPGASQLLPAVPNAVFQQSTASASQVTTSSFVPNTVIMVTQVKPSITNEWSRGLKQYKVYDPKKKKWVVVVNDVSTGLYVNREANTYYSLPSQFQ
jgi:hypothetical protein